MTTTEPAEPSSIGSAPMTDEEGDEAGMAPAEAADNDSGDDFTYGRRLRRARLAGPLANVRCAFAACLKLACPLWHWIAKRRVRDCRLRAEALVGSVASDAD